MVTGYSVQALRLTVWPLCGRPRESVFNQTLLPFWREAGDGAPASSTSLHGHRGRSGVATSLWTQLLLDYLQYLFSKGIKVRRSAISSILEPHNPIPVASQLLISPYQPHRPVKLATVRRWIVKVLEEAGVEGSAGSTGQQQPVVLCFTMCPYSR
ncbi:hypothetical protein ACOMHN_028640 [Nucella lapillus]